MRTQERHDVVHGAPAAVKLDREVVTPALLGEKKIRNPRNVRLTFRQAGIAGERFETIDEMRKATGETARPRKPDQAQLGAGEALAKRAQCRHRAHEIAQLQGAKDGDPPRSFFDQRGE